MNYSQPRLLSRPIGIEWAGWRTDTHTLQRCGWELAVDFDIRRLNYRLLLRHKMMALYALTNMHEIEQVVTDPGYDLSRLPVFQVVCVAPSIQTHMVHGFDFTRFREIDATPQISTTTIQRIEDMNIFAAPMPGAKGEVLIDGADMSVIEHLEAIKRLQSKSQEEIRQRILSDRQQNVEPSYQPPPTNKVVALVNYARAA